MEHAATVTQMESRLRRAVENQQIRVHVQPQVSLPTQQVVGAEALARWSDEVLGDVPPATFIAVAERSDLIIELGRQVLQQSCRIARTWQRQGHPRSISVNVSAVQLADPGLVDDVVQVLEVSGLDPTLLVLEVTETAAIQDFADAQSRLVRLRAMGVRTALDDFGVGQSPLTLLSALPMDILKIDHSFVSHIDQRPHDAIVTRIVIDAAHSLGIRVCAEGVESVAQAQQLLSTGCDLAQGYLISRPYDPDGGVTPDVAACRIEQIDATRTPPIPVSGDDELVLVVDHDLIITYASIGSLHLLGYSPSELIGTNVAKYVHEEGAALILRERSDRPRVAQRHRIRHRDGSWRWLQITTLRLTSPDGSRRESISTCRDVTDQVDAVNQLAGVEAQFRWAFELSPSGMAISTIGGVILQANRSFAGMLGQTPADLVGRQVSDITHPEDREQDVTNIHELEITAAHDLQTSSEARQHVVKRYLHADGTFVHAELWISTMPGSHDGLPMILAHITPLVTDPPV